MLANTMPSAVAQAMRACGRCLPAAKSLTASSAASRALLARRTFLITPSYKARIAVRAYATATATKKKAAATKTTKSTKSSTAAAKAKKPAVKKAPVKAKATAKPKAKVVKKPATKKKAKKPVVKKTVKKPKKPTEAQRLTLEKKELKETALLASDPKHLPANTWTVYAGQRFEKAAGTTHEFGSAVKGFAVDFKNLSASELSLLEQKVQENSAANAANYKKWVESHSVKEIHAANIARARLARKFPKGIRALHLRKIQDERLPKRPSNAYALFAKSHMSGTAGSGKNLPELVKQISVMWKSLPDSEKKPYEDLHAADLARYRKEMASVGLAVAERKQAVA